MNTALRNTSVRTKLTLMIMLISMIILLSISALFVAAQIQFYRTSLVDETATLASSLAANCKNLLLTNQYNEATQLLAALQLRSKYRAAYLFDEHGRPVAEYLDQTDSSFLYKNIPRDFSAARQRSLAGNGATQLTETWSYLSLFQPIEHEGRQIGTIYLLSDLLDLYGQLSGVIFATLLLMGVMLAGSWFLAGLLQKPISVPLLRLVETMQAISQRQDYSLRAKKDAPDEIGQLVDGFNQTLEQLERQQAELLGHQTALEKTVALRTDRLQHTVTELEAAKLQAEAASDAKSQFLANITHELRTPLIGVLGMNELLLKTRLSDQQQVLVETVHKSGEDLLLLINDVLDFSKIEAGELQLVDHPFELHQALEDVVALLAVQAAAKGVAVYVAIDKEATWKVRGDEQRLRQIVVNLLGNAIKFTQRGAVTVTLSRPGRVADHGDFVLSVSDTGVGITAEAQQRIFTSFYQVDAGDTRTQSGTGLGLAIVQRLVELFQGQISVESQPGVGSCFTLALRMPLIEPTHFGLPQKLLQQRLLLHLADRRAQQLLVDQLQAFGLRVVIADSATELLYQLGFAQRNQQPFAIALFNAQQQLPNGQLLSLAVREEVNSALLRRILLTERTNQLILQKQEHLLYQPVGWTALQAALTHCWHELHLLGKPSAQPLASSVHVPVMDYPRVLLAGGSVASRELLRLALAGLPLQIALAGNIAQLEALLEQQTYTALLCDLVSLPIPQLLACRTRVANFPPLFVLHTSADLSTDLAPVAAGLLEKPVSREAVLAVLQPFIDRATQASDAGDGGGDEALDAFFSAVTRGAGLSGCAGLVR